MSRVAIRTKLSRIIFTASSLSVIGIALGYEGDLISGYLAWPAFIVGVAIIWTSFGLTGWKDTRGDDDNGIDDLC